MTRPGDTKLSEARILTFRSRAIPQVDGLSEYFQKVSEVFCPYVRPSADHEQMAFTVVTSSVTTLAEVERLVFGCALPLTELLRSNRRQIASAGRRSLYCENIIFSFPQLDDAFGKPMLAWPHWVLKNSYTQVGVLFGKFCKGAVEQGKDGRPLPIPPCHLLSIRESVLARDPKFFEQADWLRPELESSEDAGQDVFGLQAKDPELYESTHRFVAQADALSFERMVRILTIGDLYDQLKERAAADLEVSKAQAARKGHIE